MSAYRNKSASPFRTIRFAPYFKLLNPLAGAAPHFPVTRNPLYQVNDTISEKVVSLQLSFSLRCDGVPRGPETEDEYKEIASKFTNVTSVSYAHPFLVVSVQILPEEPWPTFIGGVPLWLTTDPDRLSFEKLGFEPRGSKISVDEEIQEHYHVKSGTVLEIFKQVNEKGAGVENIEWDGTAFYLLGRAEPKDWKNHLPGRVNGFSMRYLWEESAISAVEEHALRTKLPAPHVEDDTVYQKDQMRPGVMLGGLTNLSGMNHLTTTSGVCVESPRTGKKFITVAAHGFPIGVGAFVFQPVQNALSQGHHIATIDRIFGDYDIALAKLIEGVSYLRETFSDPDPQNPPARAFNKLKNPDNIRRFNMVYMNTPVNGLCVGQHVRTRWALAFDATSTTPEEEAKHVQVTYFTFWGNGSDIFFDGSCGGVIWDDNFDVLGQFRFQEKDGGRLAYAPSFKILIDQGYELSQII